MSILNKDYPDQINEPMEPNLAPFEKENDEKDIETVAKFYFKTLAELKDQSLGLGTDVCDVCHKMYLCHVNLMTLQTKCLKCFAKEKTENEFKRRQPIILSKLVRETLSKLA